MTDSLRVEGLPPAIRGKITALQNAVADAAFAGSYEPEYADAVVEYKKWARYELERTIKTHLDRASAKQAETPKDVFEQNGISHDEAIEL